MSYILRLVFGPVGEFLTENNGHEKPSERRLILRIIAVVALVMSGYAFFVFNTANAQTTQDQGATQIAVQEVPKVDLGLRMPETTEIPLQEHKQIDLRLENLPGKPDDLDIDGAVMKSWVAYFEAEGVRQAQLIVTAVEQNGRMAALEQQDFVMTWPIENDPEISQGEELILPGDGAELIKALQSLQTDEAPEEQQEQVISSGSTGNDGPAQTGSSGEQVSYESPSALPRNTPAAPEAEIAYDNRTTSDGCTVEVDEARSLAVEFGKFQSFENGVLTEESACEVEMNSFPLERSTALCGDNVDIDNRVANPMYQLFYVNGQAARINHGDCQIDTEISFPIIEDMECAIQLDYIGMQAVPQSKLIYLDANNARQEVRACQASEAVAAVPLIESTDQCTIRHDFMDDQSVQLSTFLYTLNGQTFQATTCADSDITYAHTDYYDRDGIDVCGTNVDFDALTATRQYRTGITVDGLVQYITECTPDSTTLAVTQTTDTCTDPSGWTHDLSAGVSYEQVRYYYMEDGQRVWVTECQNGTTTYAHQLTNAGWQHNDGLLFSYELQRVTITAPNGEYVIEASTILPGAVQVPYIFDRTNDQWTGVSTYTGCDEFRETQRNEIYERPDGTEHPHPIGAGDTIGPINACTQTLGTPQWKHTGLEDARCSWSRGFPSWTGSFRFVYRGERQVQRTDGEVFTQYSDTTYNITTYSDPSGSKGANCIHAAGITFGAGTTGVIPYCTSYHGGRYRNSPECNPPVRFENTWNVTEGW